MTQDPVERAVVYPSDAFAFLAEMKPESVDLVITDPPYESLEKHRKVGTTTRLKQSKASSNKWFSVIPNTDLPELMRLLYRVLRPDRHAYVFCDPETLFALKPASALAGFKWKRTIVWDRVRMGMGYSYRRSYENVLFLEKGKRKTASNGVKDVLSVKAPWKGYPAEKPVEGLLDVFVRQSAQPGEMVIDPYAGSGATGVAALREGCIFQGCDIAIEAVEWARGRLDAERGSSESGCGATT